MGMDTGGSGGGPSSDINVTPLVDVCLVLLIIFMVMTPRTVPEITVAIPPDSKSKQRPPPGAEDTLVLGLTKDGGFYLNRNAMASKKALSDELKRQFDSRSKKVIFLDFDDDAVYGEAIEAMDIAKNAGAETLGIMKKKDKTYTTPDTLQGI